MNKYILIFVGLLIIPIVSGKPINAQEAGIEITPHVIDEKAKARDILEYTVKLKNNKENYAFLYAVVNDLSPEEGKQEFGEPANLDKSTSLARWIRISRGRIEIPPGEEKEIDLGIEVNMDAIPGMRHAVISFAEAQDRWTAESMAKSGVPAQIIINLDIVEEVIERAQIIEFITDKSTYFSPPVNFSLTVKNGNREIIPIGFIYVYNRRGEEIDKIKISEEEKMVLPDTVMFYNPSWTTGSAMGKYRAKLEVEYGSKTFRDLQDTLYFWVIPFRILAFVGVGVLLLIIVLSITLFRRTYHYHHPPIKAPDGVINLKGKR